jgi:hypothetical protein
VITNQAKATTLAEYYTYLPIIRYQKRPNIIGVQIEGRVKNNYQLLAPKSAVVEQIRWYECEDNQGFISFPDYLYEDYEYIKGRKLLINVKNAPEYMRVIPDKICSYIYPEYYEEYAYFLLEIIDTFHPFGIEIWNEPDTPPEILPPGHDYYYGGWNNQDEPYKAGKRYGEFLDTVYQTVKDAHPEVLLFAGALSMHGLTDKFLDGFTARGEYDVISYHAYPYYKDTNGVYNKIAEHAQAIRKYDPAAELAVTETSLLYWGDSTPPADFEAKQADYFSDSIDFCRLQEINYLWWYDINNTWRHCGLTEGGKKKAAWYRYYERLR